MHIKTVQITMPQHVARLTHMARLPATELPEALSYEEAASIICGRSIGEADLQVPGAGLWILDSKAQFGPPPEVKGGYALNAPCVDECNIHIIPHRSFSVGRSLDRCDLALPYDHVSREHLFITLFGTHVSIQNNSQTNGVFVGGGWIGPTERITIDLDVPFLIGIAEPLSNLDGSLLICPLGESLDRAMKEAVGGHRTLDEFIMVEREPWQGIISRRKTYEPVPKPKGVPHQASDISERIVTPPQILDADKYIRTFTEELREEGSHVREFIRGWIVRGQLDKHVKGYKNWDRRLLNNVRQGGMLLATHSTDLAGAAAIMRSLKIDPQYFRKGKAFFRYGLGHSYGEIVFVQQPGISGLGEINDIWDVMIPDRDIREGLLRLVQNVEYNRNIPVRVGEPAPHDPEGRSAMVSVFNEHALMELFPQFESSDPVWNLNTYVILVPDHLYKELLSQVPKQFHDWVVRIPGTGKRKKDFVRDRNNVARRTRFDGGTFEPKIGRDALFRYELVYFKIVETVLRYRHRALRKRIEKFADEVMLSRLSHPDIVSHISETTALLPEAFRVLHLRDQFKSHDGHSPLGHTMNALIEAAYLVPMLDREFQPFYARDALIALWLHDIGKMFDAKASDHGWISVDMAKYHLKMMDLQGEVDSEEQERRERILHFIENAGIISKAVKALEEGEDTSSIAKRLMPRAGSLLPELFLINFADTSSIPGRSGRKMLVNTNYKAIDVRRKLIEVFRMLLKAG